MRPVATVLATALLWALPQMLSAGESMWIYEMAKDKNVNTEIKWHMVTEAGSALIGGDFGIIALDPETGKEIWQKRELGKVMEPQVALVRGTPVMLVGVDNPVTEKKSHIVAINYMDGNEIWKSGELPGTTFGMYINATNSQLVAATAQEARRSKLASGHRKGEVTINALDLSDGHIQWAEKLPGDKAELLPIIGSAKLVLYYSLIGNQSPVFEEGTGIFALNDKIVKYDMGTGAIIWTSSAKIEESLAIADWMLWKATHNANLVSAEKDIYLSCDKRVLKISKQDGSLAWISDGFDAHIHEMRLHEDLLYVRAGGSPERVKVKGLSELGVKDPVWAAFDPKDGRRIWRYDDLKGFSAEMLFYNGRLLAAAGKKMAIVDPANGKPLKEIKLPEEGTTFFMPKGEQVVALSQQGAAALDIAQGKPVWSQYYEAPGLPRWVKMASTAVSSFLAIQGALQQVSARADLQDMVSDAGSGHLNLTSSQLNNRIDGDMNMFGKGAAMIGAGTSLYKEAMNVRYKSAAQSTNYMFFMVKLKKKGQGLLGLNLDTGEVIQEAPLEDKDPDFEIDELKGKVYVFQDQIVKALPLSK